jgi:hypothetical protein
VGIGTGITQVKMTELQHLFTTGRSVNGENFIVSTRDVGSGTRNAFMNCIGVDPSWGVGDNVGGESTLAREHNIGEFYYPTNKGSNGGMEATLRNTRLGVGYVGTERGVSGSGSGSWLTTNALEIANVQNDIYGGTAFVRPTTSNIVNNNANGWVIGGQAVLATIGDPRAEPVSAGGDNNGRPAMVNKSAAAYVNNISRSILQFIAVPGGSQNDFMPGELAATQFLLLNALDNLHDLTIPTTLIPNPGFNANLKSYTLTNNIHNNAAFTAFNASSTGRNPTRNALSSGAYSDGVALGANYISQGGTSLANAAITLLRNKIAYDFNGDGLRTLADAPDMIAAWRQRNGGPAWTAPNGTGGIAGAAGTDACIEILGDGTSDGSFTAADVRYWADGLALNAMGKLDRKAGFTAVDTAFAGNFFGTSISTGKPYAAGDSRGDVSNPTATTARGWIPLGADGIIDINDVNYVLAQFNQTGITGSADWSDLNEAVLFDLSADLTGDLKVDQADVTELVRNIMGTCTGDLNLDGKVTLSERSTVQANVGTLPATWARGDFNGDGVINASDVSRACPADINCDGAVSVQDIFDYLGLWFQNANKADINGSGSVSTQDIFDFLQAWFGGAC